MAIKDNSSPVEPEESADAGKPQPDESPPPEQQGELEVPPRAESRRVVLEANEQAPEAATDTAEDSIEERPSYGNFANLAEELDARAKSREQVNAVGSQRQEAEPDDEPQDLDFTVDDESLREHVDPEAKDAAPAGLVETEFEPAGDRTATALEEGEKDHRSSSERLRGVGLKNAEGMLDNAQNGINKTTDLFYRPPTGSHAPVKTDQPMVGIQHHGMNAGEIITATLVTGIVIGELIRYGRKMLTERGDQ